MIYVRAVILPITASSVTNAGPALPKSIRTTGATGGEPVGHRRPGYQTSKETIAWWMADEHQPKSSNSNETHGEGTAIDWGTFPGQSIAVGPCGPGEHSSKLIRSRRPRKDRYSTGLARDA